MKKFQAFVDATSPDGRARGQFVYYGAHTGRWSGRDTQPHNLTRKATDPNALDALLTGKPVDSLAALSTCIRPCIRAPKGKKLVVADLNAIEYRVLMWLAGCDAGLNVLKLGLCPYKDFAKDLFYTTYEEVTKDQRQTAKPPVLGCGYGLGGGQMGPNGKTGLWGYAENMGQIFTQHQCYDMVDLYRNKYYEVVDYWGYLEQAFEAAYSTHQRQQVGAVYLFATNDCVKIELPSGRCLHYMNPKCYDGQITFDGVRMGGWGRQNTWGGRLTENVVQAVARDVLAEGMLRADEAGMTLVMHVHDELVCEELKEHNPHEKLTSLMTAPIEWAPGLPLGAEGYETEFYMKG